MHMPNKHNPRFLLSSVSVGVHPLYNFEELSTTSIFYIDVNLLSATGVGLYLLHLIVCASEKMDILLQDEEL